MAVVDHSFYVFESVLKDIPFTFFSEFGIVFVFVFLLINKN